MSDKTKTFTIIAGVNGAGKTSLYSIIQASTKLGHRVNIDEICASMGSWRDSLTQIKAGRRAMELINQYIALGESFHYETTLPGATVIKQIKMAKENGFEIFLYFVGVNSVDIAIERVHKRISRGGHGIEDNIIQKRYEKIPETLREILPLCDRAFFYDNTMKFRQFAIVENGELIDCDSEIPAWFQF